MTENTMILQVYKPLDKSSYKIVCKATGIMDFDSAQKNVSRMFKNKFRVIRNSLKSQGDNLYSMVVKANVKSIAADCLGEKSNKHQITAGIYTDATDNSIWKMEDINGEKRLVMEETDGLEACFNQGNKSIVSAALNTNVDVASGDFITFYNTKAGAVQAGFALISEEGSMEAFNENEEFVPLNEDEVINAVDLTGCGLNPVQAALEKGEATKVLDYMKKIYKDSSMISELKKIMDFKYSEDKKFETKASLDDMDFEEIKQDIQNFIVNKAVDDLKAQITNPIMEEPIIIEEANSDGDIDFASETEMQDYLENPETKMNDEVQQAEADADEDETFVNIDFEPEKPVEEVTEEDDYIDNELNDILDEGDIGVTTEADLDSGDFQDMEPEELEEDKLISKLTSMLGENE